MAAHCWLSPISSPCNIPAHWPVSEKEQRKMLGQTMGLSCSALSIQSNSSECLRASNRCLTLYPALHGGTCQVCALPLSYSLISMPWYKVLYQGSLSLSPSILYHWQQNYNLKCCDLQPKLFQGWLSAGLLLQYLQHPATWLRTRPSRRGKSLWSPTGLLTSGVDLLEVRDHVGLSTGALDLERTSLPLLNLYSDPVLFPQWLCQQPICTLLNQCLCITNDG